MTDIPGPRDIYLGRAERHGQSRLELEAASRRLGTIRFAAFVVALVPWVVAEFNTSIPDSVGFASIPLLVVFAVLVARHRRLKDRLVRASVAEELALEGVARIERRWNDLPPPPERPGWAGPEHAWAADLDVYGRASLRALMGPTRTPMGRTRLDAWLTEDADFTAAAERQPAVQEMSGLHEVREAAAVEATLVDPVEEGAVERFIDWCGRPAILPATERLAARVLPPLTILLGIGDIVGVVGGWAWFLGLAAQSILAWRWGHRLHPYFAEASSGVPGLRRYHRLLAVWEGLDVESPLLAEAIETLRGPDHSASEALSRLDRWLTMADARFSSLHPVFAVGLLWDLNVARSLDDWRASAGQRAEGWLAALGSLEALSALATLASDHPDWSFPELEPADGAPRFEAEQLGHPLLEDSVAVRNDVSLGPPGRVLLITGSNMAGKSTLLRSLGLAVVLAAAGAPVCARRLRLTEGRLFTSMRVQDSIEAGVSFFMAELQRLAALLRAAPAAESHEAPLIYLVDEILQGTNSDERRIAGRRLVRHLLRRRAIGAVTTHDLEFHGHPEIEAAATLAHFRESVERTDEGEGLSFDYRLRPGLATTRNALRLAERVGLTDPDAGAVGGSGGEASEGGEAAEGGVATGDLSPEVSE